LPVFVASVALTASVAGAGVSQKAGERRVGLAAAAAAASLEGDLLTYGYGTSRSGESPATGSIRGVSAAPAWNDDALDGAVYGEPLVDGTTVYVATENDSVYALDAASGRVRWHAHVGTAVPVAVVDSAPSLSGSCGDIDPLGITGTPVIDPAKGELFAAEETELPGRQGWTGIRHWLVALDLSSGRELWHRVLDPPSGAGSAAYVIPAEQQRPALSLLDGRLYVPFGGLAGDCGQYHGYVVSLPESGSGPLDSYRVPSDREGAIWETEGALVAPSGGLYVATGNGSSSSISHFDEGNAVVELSSSLTRLGYWAPADWTQLNDSDGDLGSSGPIQVPSSSLLFIAGKATSSGSVGYLVREGALGGIGHGAFSGPVCTSGGVFGSDASDVLGAGAGQRVLIFAPCGGGTVALEVNLARQSFRRIWSSSGASPNGSPIVAGGVVWVLDWSSGTLDALSPASGDLLFQRQTDALDHFAVPALAAGMVIIPTAHGAEAFRTTS
jgi:outer membrane protein assembly factor BamB